MHWVQSTLPWLIPGTLFAVAVGIVAGPRLARALGVRAPVIWLLVAGFGMAVAATLTPLDGVLWVGRDVLPCDFSRVALAPLGLLIRPTDALMNVLLFLPLGTALGLLPVRGRSLALIAAAVALPFVIEATQLLVPVLGRGCESADVIDNLTGLVIGLGLGTIVRLAIGRPARESTAS